MVLGSHLSVLGRRMAAGPRPCALLARRLSIGGSGAHPAAQGATEYDYIVLGGGSGGMASSRRAAKYGARVAVVERGPLGGTCVNVGCVPKKVMWSASEVADTLAIATDYGFSAPACRHEDGQPRFGFKWEHLKSARDAYIKRLNGIYQSNLANDNVDILHGSAVFESALPGGGARVRVGDKVLSAPNVLIAVGGAPTLPEVPGAAEWGITSDGFFEMERQPKTVAVFGAGYIAVELAGVLRGLGTDVTLFTRKDGALRSFDSLVTRNLARAAPGCLIPAISTCTGTTGLCKRGGLVLVPLCKRRGGVAFLRRAGSCLCS